MSVVVSAGEAQRVLLCEAGTEELVDPVGIRAVIVIGFEHAVDIDARHSLIVYELCGVHDFRDFCKVVPYELYIVCNGSSSPFALLCRDQYDTVTCLGTVDCCRGCILEHFHAFDHRRVEVVDIVYLKAVNDEQWADIAGV